MSGLGGAEGGKKPCRAGGGEKMGLRVDDSGMGDG